MRKFIVLIGDDFPRGKNIIKGTLNTVPDILIKKYPESVRKTLTLNNEGKVKEIDIVNLLFVLDFTGYEIKETFNSIDGTSVFAVV